MANRTYLVGMNDDYFTTDAPEGHVLLEASYFMPVLWLALFKLDDIKFEGKLPFPITGRAQALATFDARRPGLAKYLGGEADRLLGQFRQFIEEHSYAHYLINTHELYMMQTEEGEFLDQLSTYLDDMEHLGAGERTERRIWVFWQSNEKLDDYPSDLNPYYLCGTTVDHDMPWESKAAA